MSEIANVEYTLNSGLLCGTCYSYRYFAVFLTKFSALHVLGPLYIAENYSSIVINGAILSQSGSVEYNNRYVDLQLNLTKSLLSD